MTFNFFSLDYFYYPVSGIMWVWHKFFGFIFRDYSNPWAWVLSVVFLVFTLRIVLFKPFLKQMDSQLKMQAIQPELKKVREKYKGDRQRQTEETMKLNKEAGVNPLASCLPALVQMPVFISLYHVLRSFKPGWEQVYFFGKNDVVSFVDAKLFGGAPLSSYIAMKDHTVTSKSGPVVGLLELGGHRPTVIAVSIPLMILAAIATHLTSRRSVARQREMNIDNTGNAQAAIMNKLMLYVFPIGVLIFGIFFPIANLFYWLSNNSWTFAQLAYAHRAQDRKKALSAQVVEEAKEITRFTKPAPGARPTKSKRPLLQPTSLVTPPGDGMDDGTADPTGTVAAEGGSQVNGTLRGSSPAAGPSGGTRRVGLTKGAVTDAANGAAANGTASNSAASNGAASNAGANGGAANGPGTNGAGTDGAAANAGARPAGGTGKKRPGRAGTGNRNGGGPVNGSAPAVNGGSSDSAQADGTVSSSTAYTGGGGAGGGDGASGGAARPKPGVKTQNRSVARKKKPRR